MMLLIWAMAIVGAYLFYNYFGQSTPDQRASDQKPPNRDTATVQQILSAPLVPNKHVVLPSAPRPNEDAQHTAPLPPAAPSRPKPEELAAAKMRWIDIKGQIEGIREDLDPALGDAETWMTLVRQLPGNEAGKRIAGSKTHVDQYRALLEQPRQPARLAMQCRDTLQVHLETAQRYLGQADNTTVPSSELVQELDRLNTEAKTLRQEYHRDRLALEGLVSETAKMPAAEITLEKAAEQREREVAAEYLAQLTATRAAAEAEAQKKLREAEEKAIKQKAQEKADSMARLATIESQRIRDETEQRLVTEKEAAVKRKRDEEAARLRALADDPEIQRLYACFLQKGFLQFTGPPRGQMSKSQRPMSVSFGDLNRKGWLKDAESFAQAMSRSPSPNWDAINDRPTRGYPKTDAEWAEMDRLLQQFKTLGPIWVEMRLLEP